LALLPLSLVESVCFSPKLNDLDHYSLVTNYAASYIVNIHKNSTTIAKNHKNCIRYSCKCFNDTQNYDKCIFNSFNYHILVIMIYLM